MKLVDLGFNRRSPVISLELHSVHTTYDPLSHAYVVGPEMNFSPVLVLTPLTENTQ